MTELETSRIILHYFMEFMRSINGPIQMEPEAAPMLAALKEALPDATSDGLLAKFTLIFAGGFTCGIEFAQAVSGKATMQ